MHELSTVLAVQFLFRGLFVQQLSRSLALLLDIRIHIYELEWLFLSRCSVCTTKGSIIPRLRILLIAHHLGVSFSREHLALLVRVLNRVVLRASDN